MSAVVQYYSPDAWRPDPTRLPPQSIEAEQGVIGSIFLDNAVLPDVLRLLSIDDFYRDAHQLIFAAIVDIYQRGEAVDVVTLANELERRGQFEKIGGDEALGEIANAPPHSAHAKYYAQIVKEKSEGRQVIDAATDIMRLAYSNQYTSSELKKKLIDVVDGLVDERMTVEDEQSTVHPLPVKMRPEAFRGVAGEIVNIINPETEACPEAVLGQFLVAFGNLMGPRPHWVIGNTRHRCNLFLCLVGPTGIGRKGTAWDVTQWLLNKCDPSWADTPYLTGIASGEGIIKHCQDADGPVLAVEDEFGKTIGKMEIEGASLGSIIRQAWNGPVLCSRTRKDSLECYNAYLSIVGHITIDELKNLLSAQRLSDGFANRFCWMHVYRDGVLPEGGDFGSLAQALSPYQLPLYEAVAFAREPTLAHRPFVKTKKAVEFYDFLYRGRFAAPKSGVYAKVTDREAPMVLRLSVIYAVLDRSPKIDVKHIESALAFWDYCDDTARHLWGSPRADGDLEKLLDSLKNCPEGMSRDQINRKVFGSHKKAAAIEKLLAQAQGAGLVVHQMHKTGGAPKRVYFFKISAA